MNRDLSFGLKVFLCLSVLFFIPGSYLIILLGGAFLYPISILENQTIILILGSLIFLTIFIFGIYTYINENSKWNRINSLLLFIISTPIPLVFLLNPFFESQPLNPEELIGNLYFMPMLVWSLIIGILYKTLDVVGPKLKTLWSS